MNKKALALAGIFMLAGCASPQAATPPSVSVDPAATATPKATPTKAPTNSRGNVAKKIGEVAYLGSADGKPSGFNFKVTSIEKAICDNPYPTEPKGTLVAITIEAETTADFRGIYDEDNPMVDFNPHGWRAYASNGTRMNEVATAASYGCYADQAKYLPANMGKGEKVNGVVVLDLTTPSGQVAYSLTGFATGGWEYEYAVQ